MMTAFVRGYKRAFPDENIRLRRQRREIWLNNPHLNIGNHENGLTLRAPSALKDFLGHFPKGTARDMGFELMDPTPEVFLTDEERAVEYWPADGRLVAAIDNKAQWVTRAWPPERWAAVARALLDGGWAVVEVGHGTKPKVRIPHTYSFFGQHSIRQTAAVLRRADLYLGNDSGLLHLAAAVGTPQVAVFGPVPYRDRGYSNTTPVEAAQPCGRHCGQVCIQPRAGKPRCMDEISVADVMAAVSHATVAR
jgi:ADP-heptose:LPS heptosyltransferase